jgi:hypothetical protein
MRSPIPKVHRSWRRSPRWRLAVSRVHVKRPVADHTAIHRAENEPSPGRLRAARLFLRAAARTCVRELRGGCLPACLPACWPSVARRPCRGHADGLARSLQGDDPICTSGGEWGLLYPEPRHPAVGFPPVLHRCVPCPDCSRRSLTRGSLRCRTLSAALSSHSVARRDLVDAMFDQIATFMGQPIESKLSAAVDESSPIWCVGSTRRLVVLCFLAASRCRVLPAVSHSSAGCARASATHFLT